MSASGGHCAPECEFEESHVKEERKAVQSAALERETGNYFHGVLDDLITDGQTGTATEETTDQGGDHTGDDATEGTETDQDPFDEGPLFTGARAASSISSPYSDDAKAKGSKPKAKAGRNSKSKSKAKEWKSKTQEDRDWVLGRRADMFYFILNRDVNTLSWYKHNPHLSLQHALADAPGAHLGRIRAAGHVNFNLAHGARHHSRSQNQQILRVRSLRANADGLHIGPDLMMKHQYLMVTIAISL